MHGRFLPPILHCVIYIRNFRYLQKSGYFPLEHTHPFNGFLSGTTRVSRYQKGKTNLDFTEATGNEWQWHQLGHMQVCTSLQTDNHASTPPLSFFTDRMPFLSPNQQRQRLKALKLPSGSLSQTPVLQNFATASRSRCQQNSSSSSSLLTTPIRQSTSRACLLQVGQL